ncbi:TetR/AcrR family transcriptional regulator [Martelella mediterranea]|nr:TetR/AcrR family transcriptional regulator [Martelella mediterranea]
MEKESQPTRGRRRGFDRDEAVDMAMRLFWRHGYEGVSINDLTGAMGIAPPSLYAAFGTKADLYREALQRYTDRPETQFHPEPRGTLAETIRHLLETAADAVTSPEGETGCMVSTGLLACGEAHADLAQEVAAIRKGMHPQLVALLKRWLAPRNAQATATYLLTLMQGMAIQARDGADRATLQQIIEISLSGLPGNEAAKPDA